MLQKKAKTKDMTVGKLVLLTPLPVHFLWGIAVLYGFRMRDKFHEVGGMSECVS